MNADWWKKLDESGHVLAKDAHGDIDFFALNHGIHNGPACVTCGAQWCEHCQPEIEPCPNKPQLS
jgi:hypothetical protein